MDFLADIPDALISVFAEKPLVFIDVGAAGAPPWPWQSLASKAVYVGFDPDARERPVADTTGFHQFHIVSKAIIDTDATEATFNLTANPQCSSLLRPHAEHLSHYGFSDMFTVEHTATVPATNFSEVIRELKLQSVDWLKLDTQGKDIDLFLSLDSRWQSSVMAVDIEPGVIDFYHGENTMDQAHTRMIEKGFWLAKSNMLRFPRISKTTRQVMAGEGIDFEKLPGCPIAHEGTYLCTLELFTQCERDMRDYIGLWLIALANDQLGFAFDVSLAAKQAFPDDERAGMLYLHTRNLTQTYLADQCRKPVSVARKIVPKALQPLAIRMRNFICGKRS